jgi:hypothetical protein
MTQGWVVSMPSLGASLAIQAGKLISLPRPSPEVDCDRTPVAMLDERTFLCALALLE